MIEVHSLASWLRVVDGVSSKSHVDSLSGTSFTSLGAEHYLGQQGRLAGGSLAVVGIHIAVIQTNWTSGNLTGVRVVLAASRKVGKI